MRIGLTVICVALVTGCARISGSPSLPASASLASAPSVIDNTGQYLSLYSFRGKSSGGLPQAGLVSIHNALYGTTSSYGSGYGTVFKATQLGRVTPLYTFKGYPDGAYPQVGLVDLNGTLYGTTSAGGTHGGGTVFAITTSGAERVLHSFGKGSDGVQPEAGLLAYRGVLYGTTEYGGTHREGLVYEITPRGAYHVLHEFTGPPRDCAHSTAPFIAVDGELYGTARAGGKNPGGGCVFKMSSIGEVTLLHSFKVQPGDGANPDGALVYVNGLFYGTTLHGGDVGSGLGTVFRINASGGERVIHSFGGGKDGALPMAGLTAVNGELYGTTIGGGTSAEKSNDCVSSGLRVDSSSGYFKCGTIFEITTSGQERVLYRFRGAPDGANPQAPLTLLNGALYGTTDWGGRAVYYGTVFRIFP